MVDHSAARGDFAALSFHFEATSDMREAASIIDPVASLSGRAPSGPCRRDAVQGTGCRIHDPGSGSRPLRATGNPWKRLNIAAT
jgi:hypothetical protein